MIPKTSATTYPVGTPTSKRRTVFTGPQAANQYVSGDPNTPTIAGLEGGADVYGLIDLTATQNSAIQSALNAIGSPPSGAVLSVSRIASNYTGYDMLVIQNLSDVSLSTPMLSVGGTSSSSELALQIRGNGAAQTLTSLNPGQVWVPLIPTSETDVYASVATNDRFGRSTSRLHDTVRQ